MTEPVRTRETVEQEVREWVIPGVGLKLGDRVGRFVAAALLAMGECEHGDLATYTVETLNGPAQRCSLCSGTGLDQSRLARGLNALEGR